jgi:hypothetical protein
MIDCVIYSLFSGNASFISIQYPTLKQYATTCRIIALEDALYPCDPPIQVEHITITTVKWGPPTGFRACPIAETLFREIVPNQQERYAVFLHGDMLAVAPITMESLFNNKTYVVAGRRIRSDGTPHWATQILGIDTSRSVLPKWWAWDYKQANVIPVKREFFDDRQHIEWIGPFKHMTAMGVNLKEKNPLP